jgi:hypothetical protein
VQEQVLRWQIDPETEFNRSLNELFFSSTFGRYSGGGHELEQASPIDAREFQRKYLTPNNSHLVLVGEVDPAIKPPSPIPRPWLALSASRKCFPAGATFYSGRTGGRP